MRREFSFPLKVEEVKAQGDAWEVAGYAATYGNVDLGGDVILPGAFDRTLKERDDPVRFFLNHNPSAILGVHRELRTDSKGLFARSRISKTQLGQDTHVLLEDGALDSYSIGYIATDTDFTDNGEVRQLKGIELLEVSLVAMPMNPKAKVTNVKAFLQQLWGNGQEQKDIPFAEHAGQVLAELRGFLDRSRDLLSTLESEGHTLSGAKHQQLTEMAETFSAVVAVQSEIEKLLNSKAVPDVRSINIRLELARKRNRDLLRAS